MFFLLVSFLAYSHFFITKLPKARPLLRLFFALPIFYFFSIFPWAFPSSPSLRGVVSYFITWIASFKIILFCFHRGPLVSSSNDFSLIDFLVVSILPVKRGAVSAPTKRYELMPLFNHPYFATSLREFWGRRWNLLSSYILRLTVYDPTRTALSGIVGPGPGKVGATIAALGVSGAMHEVMMYHITCGTKPTWEVSRFFLLQGLCIVVEAALRKRCGSVHVAVANALTVGFVVITSYWLLVLPVLNNGQSRCNGRHISKSVEDFYRESTTNILHKRAHCRVLLKHPLFTLKPEKLREEQPKGGKPHKSSGHNHRHHSGQPEPVVAFVSRSAYMKCKGPASYKVMIFNERLESIHTLDTSFPDSVGVFETRNDVMADLESEHEPVMATFLQSEPQTLRFSTLWYWKNNVISSSCLDCKAQDLHFWLKGFYFSPITKHSSTVNTYIQIFQFKSIFPNSDH
ncbi:putative long-chain-alcohol O-fatty-acyltransferase 5 [Senna tora]|uniref:Putative long-chain-alcohol O-fatty-acyltransferase 5 n=1 Tax=Senna tora TaxID=362788 RepID=A0A834SGU0_9FABA|nr:putative long-chain-alcohol O-fatty-acyltransferase 5 [Senna tora]